MAKAGVTKAEMVLLAELFLRGPQTVGELRGRASRMAPMDSIEMVRNTLGQLMNKAEAMVKELPPAPGSRAERFVQLICPNLHDLNLSAEAAEPPAAGGGPAAPSLGQRVANLEAEVSLLRSALAKLASEVGATNPFDRAASAEPTTDAGETQPS